MKNDSSMKFEALVKTNELEKGDNQPSKIEEQLKKLDGIDDSTLRAVKLTVEQMKYLLLNSEDGETAYHKLFQKVVESREKLKTAVEQEHNKTTIQKYKKYIQEHMAKIEGYIDALELASRDFVDRETDIYLKNSETFEEEIAKLAIIETLYNDLEKECNSLKKEFENTTKELEETKKVASGLEVERDTALETIQGLKYELSDVKENLRVESRKVSDLIEKDNEEIKDLQGKLEMEIQAKTDAEKKMFEIEAKEFTAAKDRDVYKERSEELREFNNSLNDINKSLNKRVEILNNDLSNKSDEISVLANDLKIKSGEISTLTKEKEKLHQEKDELKELLKSEKQRYEKMIEELQLKLKKQETSAKGLKEK